MKNKNKTITVVLLILWILSVAGFYSYYAYQSFMRNHSAVQEEYHSSMIPFAVSFFCLFPLILLVKKYSKLAQMKKINLFVSVFAYLYGFAAFVALFAMCAALVSLG